MLQRRQTSARTEKDWFIFSSAISTLLASDYISMRLLYCIEPLTTGFTVLGRALDVAEKSLKLLVVVQSQTSEAISLAGSEYGHNIEKLRSKAAEYESVFNDEDIRAFSKDLNDKSGKLYQHIRYGSEITTEGFHISLEFVVPVVDKIFLNSVLKLPEHWRRVLMFCSPLKNVVTASRFDQSQNRAIILQALRHQNPRFGEFEALCAQLDADHESLTKQLEQSAKNGEPQG